MSGRKAASTVAIGRIELLYPFPRDQVAKLIGTYPKLREIVWLQEEPANMGARKWVDPASRRTGARRGPGAECHASRAVEPGRGLPGGAQGGAGAARGRGVGLRTASASDSPAS